LLGFAQLGVGGFREARSAVKAASVVAKW
jgi:hypothetical protein